MSSLLSTSLLKSLACLVHQPSLLAPTVLVGMLHWGLAENSLNQYYSAQYRPAMRCSDTLPSDTVTVVCRTLNPPPIFKECLIGWLENKPLEVIISTTEEFEPLLQKIKQEIHAEQPDFGSKIKIVVSVQGAREQLMTGVQHAKGDIIATTDNHIMWPKTYLAYMLPCFDDPRVGAAGPPIAVLIPKERQNANEINMWEVAAMRMANRDAGAASSALALDVIAQWRWILPGTTCIYQAYILKGKACRKGYLSDTWNGVKLDVGEDTWLSRFILKQNLILATQRCDEVVVHRTVKRTAAFHDQVLRWERSTIQSYIRTILEVPQMFKHPFIVFKTIERLLKTPLLIVHLIAWIVSLIYYPGPTLVLLAYYMYYKYKSVKSFIAAYPYMAKYWWVVVLLDFSGLYINAVASCTLSNNAWDQDEGGRDAN
ncbi:hypothetical protein WAI453_006808 [Rhynchosporium graminicola]